MVGSKLAAPRFLGPSALSRRCSLCLRAPREAGAAAEYLSESYSPTALYRSSFRIRPLAAHSRRFCASPAWNRTYRCCFDFCLTVQLLDVDKCLRTAPSAGADLSTCCSIWVAAQEVLRLRRASSACHSLLLTLHSLDFVSPANPPAAPPWSPEDLQQPHQLTAQHRCPFFQDKQRSGLRAHQSAELGLQDEVFHRTPRPRFLRCVHPFSSPRPSPR